MIKFISKFKEGGVEEDDFQFAIDLNMDDKLDNFAEPLLCYLIEKYLAMQIEDDGKLPFCSSVADAFSEYKAKQDRIGRFIGGGLCWTDHKGRAEHCMQGLVYAQFQIQHQIRGIVFHSGSRV
jgi:phage/plasmid-associated DNA primase